MPQNALCRHLVDDCGCIYMQYHNSADLHCVGVTSVTYLSLHGNKEYLAATTGVIWSPCLPVMFTSFNSVQKVLKLNTFLPLSHLDNKPRKHVGKFPVLSYLLNKNAQCETVVWKQKFTTDHNRGSAGNVDMPPATNQAQLEHVVKSFTRFLTKA